MSVTRRKARTAFCSWISGLSSDTVRKGGTSSSKVLKTDHANSSDTACVDAKIFDSPALVNMLPQTNCKIFLDHANKVFLSYVETHSKTINRVDLVWDHYFEKSLKGRTWSNRGVVFEKGWPAKALYQKLSFIPFMQWKQDWPVSLPFRTCH